MVEEYLIGNGKGKFWSSKSGWVTLGKADLYRMTPKESLTPPLDGYWFRRVGKRKVERVAYRSMEGAMLDAYIECALWSSCDWETGAPLDDDYGPEDLAPATLASMREDCESFARENANAIGGDWERAGHDFWLTRNHHGAGFWDGRWESTVGQRLTESAHTYGSVDLYVGDDGRIYG